MKYHSINNQLFIKNRANFTAQMKPGSIAVFNSNDIYTTGADSTMPFHQHRDIFYLSGVDQEESILVLFPDAMDAKHREVLFVRETNDHIAIWEGAKLTKEQATKTSGIATVYWLTDFDKVFRAVLTGLSAHKGQAAAPDDAVGIAIGAQDFPHHSIITTKRDALRIGLHRCNRSSDAEAGHHNRFGKHSRHFLLPSGASVFIL